MANSYYLTENAILFEGVFHDFGDSTKIKIPDDVIFKVYSYDWSLIEEIPVTDHENGRYSHYYSFNEPGTYYYEWNGGFGGVRSLDREEIRVRRI